MPMLGAPGSSGAPGWLPTIPEPCPLSKMSISHVAFRVQPFGGSDCLWIKSKLDVLTSLYDLSLLWTPLLPSSPFNFTSSFTKLLVVSTVYPYVSCPCGVNLLSPKHTMSFPSFSTRKTLDNLQNLVRNTFL